MAVWIDVIFRGTHQLVVYENKKKVRADMMPCSDESCLLILGRFLAIDFQIVVECYIRLHLLRFSH